MDYSQMPEADETALWIRESKSGKTYMSGVVKYKGEQIKIVLFKNENKEGKQPDYSFKKKEERINYQKKEDTQIKFGN